MLQDRIRVEDLVPPVLPEGHPVRFDPGGPFMFPCVVHFKPPSGGRALEMVQESPELTPPGLPGDGAAQVLEGQLARARADLERVRSDPHLLNNLGSILLNSQQFQQARECFAEAVALRPGFYEAQSNLAKTYLREGKPESALEVYQALLQQRPDDTRVLMNVAHAYLRMDQLDQSSDCLDKIIRLDAANGSAFHNRGLLKMAQKRWPEAVRDLRRATRLDVRFVDAYNALGVCYFLQGSLGSAERASRTAFALAPLNESAMVNYVLLLCAQDRSEKALALVENYLARQPTALAPRLVQAALLMKLEQFDRCLNVLDKMEDLTEQLRDGSRLKPWVKFNRGIVYEIKQDERRAEREYRDAIECAQAVWRDPSPAVFFYAGLALLYMRQDRLGEARELLETCERQCPEDALVLMVLSLLHGSQGDWPEALRLVERAAERDPTSSSLQCVRGRMYGELGQREQEIECYRLALRSHPSDALALNSLAYAYLMRGDIQLARQVLDDAPVDEPNVYLTATRGLLLIKEGDLLEGRRLYNRAAQKASTPQLRNRVHQKKHLELGRRFLEQGDIGRAQAELGKVARFGTAGEEYVRDAQLLLDGIRTDAPSTRWVSARG